MSKSELLQQAALVLKSLPKGEAAKIMSKLEAADMRLVVKQSNELEEAGMEEVLTALNQLALEAEPLRTSRDEKRRLLNHQLRVGDDALEEVDSGPFRFLVHLAPEIRCQLLANEHPGNLALVMMHLPTGLSTELLHSLESPLQVSTVRRLCEFEDVSEARIAELAANLRMRLQRRIGRDEAQNGVRLAAQLLSCSDDDTREEVLAYINQLDPDLVSELEGSIFRFEDLRELDDLDVQVILKNVDTTYWAPALKASSTSVREKLMGNMAPKVAEMLSQEICDLHVLDEQISIHAQTQIVNVCVLLNEQGKIDLP